MSENSRSQSDDSIQIDRLVDSICDDFEKECLSGDFPKLESFLEQVHGVSKQNLLRELVSIEIYYRQKRGESVSFLEYQSRFPELEAEHLQAAAARGNRSSEQSINETVGNLSSFQKQERELVRYFGDYELLSIIAQGGMGIVYKARQLSLNRVVALKMILSGEFASQQEIDRFYSEAKAAALLDHPGIVPIFEVGEHQGNHFFSMTYVEGTSLASKIKDGPLEPREAARIISLVARAIQFAHEQGVIHRDLKPANVLLDDKGAPRITDFGLAKHVQDDSHATATGQVLGTPSYMPPEQAIGKNALIGPPSDVYGIGGVLYAALSGRPPFQAATSVETLRQVLENQPVPLCQLNSSIPRDLETITLKCLEKTIAKRYSTAAELADELERVLRREPILARRVTPLEHMWRWCLRNPHQAILSAAASVFAICLLIGLPFTLAIQTELRRVEKLKTAAESDRQHAQQLLAEAREQERLLQIKTHFGNAIDFRRSHKNGQRFDSLRELELASSLNPTGKLRRELRNHLINSLTLADMSPAAPIASLPERAPRDLRISENRKVWAYTQGGVCQLYRAGIDQEWFKSPGDQVELNASGSAMLTRAETSKRLQCFDLSGENPKKTLVLDGCNTAIFNSNDAQIIVVLETGELAIYDVFQGTKLRSLGTIRLDEAGYSPHPKRPVMAKVGSDQRTVQICSLMNGEILSETGMPNNARIHYFAWSPDGTTLAVGTNDSYIDIFEFNPVAESLQWMHSIFTSQAASKIKFDPSGTRLATWGWSSMLDYIDVASGRRMVQSGTSPRTEMRGMFSTNGNSFFGLTTSDEQKVGSWNVAPGNELLSFTDWNRDARTVDSNHHFCVDPLNEVMASMSIHGRLAFYSLKSSRFLGSTQIGQRGGQSLFDPLGNLITTSDIGVLFWPVKKLVVEDALQWQIGPPERLPIAISYEELAINTPGNQIALAFRAIAREPGVWIVNTQEDYAPNHFMKGNIATVQFSPDGKWLSAGEHLDNVSVWDLQSKQKIKVLSEGNQFARFTRDGKWIGVQADENRLFSVGDWKAGPQLGEGRLADFSHDSRFAILITDSGELRLMEMETFSEIGRFEHPEKKTAHFARFSPDGRFIVAAFNLPDGELLAWDLKRIREGLEKFDLTDRWPTFTEVGDKFTPDDMAIKSVNIVGVDEYVDERQRAIGVHNRSIELVHRASRGELGAIEQKANQILSEPKHKYVDDVLYNIACAYSQASSKVPEPESYAMKAIEVLNQLLDKGYFKPTRQREHVKSDVDLVPLANHVSFIELLKRIEAQP